MQRKRPNALAIVIKHRAIITFLTPWHEFPKTTLKVRFAKEPYVNGTTKVNKGADSKLPTAPTKHQ